MLHVSLLVVYRVGTMTYLSNLAALVGLTKLIADLQDFANSCFFSQIESLKQIANSVLCSGCLVKPVQHCD